MTSCRGVLRLLETLGYKELDMVIGCGLYGKNGPFLSSLENVRGLVNVPVSNDCDSF